MIRTFHLSLAALALSSVVAAQTVRASMVTADAVGVHANRQIDGARAGTAIEGRGLRLHANDERSAAASSHAVLAPMRTAAGDTPAAAFHWTGHAQAGNIAGTLGGAPLAAGAQSYTLSLAARGDVPGRLMMTFGGNARNARAGAIVRVGRMVKTFVADGNPQRDAIELTGGAGGVDVAIEIAGSANSANSRTASAFGCELRVFFAASGGGGGGCTVTGDQRSCPEGGILAGRAQAGRQGIDLGLALQGALPNSIGITVVSPTNRTFTIGNTNCIFFGMPIIAGTFTTDANGDGNDRLSFPARAGGNFYVNTATLLVSPRGYRLATSNSLQVSCR